MPKLAETVSIRHECDCENATAPPGEGGSKHVFQIDGVDFPWHLTQHGPTVRLNEHGLYEITVTILANHVEGG